MPPMGEDRTRMQVGGASPYDVVVGHGVLDEVSLALGPDVRRVAVCHPESLTDLADQVVAGLGGVELPAIRPPAREAAQTPPGAADAGGQLGRARVTPPP